jgi:hypothetical protein
MPQSILPDYVFDDLIRFIRETRQGYLRNSLLIAQDFILKYHDYGKEFGLMKINKAIEEGMKQSLFN